jgi:hypothetical protein
MGILTEQKGQGTGFIMGIMGAVMGAIMLSAMLPVLQAVIATVAGGNMSAFSNQATILMLLGMTGLIVVIMYIYTIIQGFMNPQSSQGGF